MKGVLLYFLFFCALDVFAAELPQVETSDGKLQGHFSTTYGNRKFIEFIGIPYALPPVGKLRFEESKPMKPWQGTWVANVSSECLQISHWPEPEGGVSSGTEDCLHLDIFIPNDKINPKANYDVHVHIHGGAFMFGSKEVYAGPKYLLDNDIILVRINYRVGIFGFLSTLDENLPGNLGMKDQVLALQWVKKNIKHFGGNQDSITISGLSAGGASVHYHLLSPLSKVVTKSLATRLHSTKLLAQSELALSGCALNPWTIQEEPLEKALIIGKHLGCNIKDTKELKACLKWRNARQINEATRILRPWLFTPFSPLGLVVDKSSKRPFLPEHPYKLLLDGKVHDVPWIVSSTTSEGLYPIADVMVKDEYLLDLDNRWEELSPFLLHYSESAPKKLKSGISKKIKAHYLGDESISKSTFKELIQIVSDRLFVYDMDIAARLHSKAIKSQVYFYQYNYTGEVIPSLVPLFTGLNEYFGVCHGDDILFIFSDTHASELPEMTDSDINMKNFLTKLWSDFSRTGEPHIDWIPVSKKTDDLLEYLYIGSADEIEMRTAEELGHRSFWSSLPLEENENLFRNSPKTEL